MKLTCIVFACLLLAVVLAYVVVWNLSIIADGLPTSEPALIRGSPNLLHGRVHPDRLLFSVVIVNYNEPLLWATVDSVLNNTHSSILGEILIIDDLSPEPVVNTRNLPAVRIIRATERLGLIRARSLGGNSARYDIIAMIDAHVCVALNWLDDPQKLIQSNYKRMVVPSVLNMPQDKFQMGRGITGIGSSAGFTWGLRQFWGGGLPTGESAMTMGEFFMSKKWWDELEGMDEGMNTWGGENVEISLKCWLCGGEIVGSGKSVISHRFRKSFPYTVRSEDVQRNLVRIAEVWLDGDYLDHFYRTIKKPRGSIDFGDISKPISLKQRLQCRSFTWFVEKFRDASPCEPDSKTCGKRGVVKVNDLPEQYR